MLRYLNEIEQIGSYAWELFWIPLIVWSVAALTVLLILRAFDFHPTTHYFARLAVLMVIPAGILITTLMPAQSLITNEHAIYPVVVAVYELGSVSEVQIIPEQQQAHWIHNTTPVFWIGLLSLISHTVAILLLGRNLFRYAALCWLRRKELTPADSVVKKVADEIMEEQGGKIPSLRIMTHEETVVPYTFGWMNPVVVLPVQAVSDHNQLRSLLAHEIMHVRRGDYLIEWITQSVCAICWFHPLVQVYVRDIHRYREMSCDAEVISGMIVDPRSYAGVLLRFAESRPPSHMPVMIPMATQKSRLKERIEAMQFYPKSPETNNKTRSGSLKSAFAIFLAGVVVIMLTRVETSFSMISDADVNEAGISYNTQLTNPEPLSVTSSDSIRTTAEVMPEIRGGMQALYEHLRYPEMARRAGVEGRVVLQFVVDQQGRVVDPKAIRGIGAGADEAAIEALRSVQFSPGTVDGKPVSVEMMLPVVFRLSGAGSGDGERGVQPPPPPPTPPAQRNGPPPPPTPPTEVPAEVFTVVEKMPEPIGGLQAIYEHLRYPEAARRAGIEGRVIVQFIVDEQGNVTNPEVIRGIGGGADEAAVAAVKQVKFTPGIQRGQPVKVMFQLPVQFRLPSQDN